METIKFYSYIGHNRTINKILHESTDIKGDIVNDVDMLRPVITIRQNNVPKFNYCYIPTLKRYYFIDRIVNVGGHKYELSLTVDALKSYENEILEAFAMCNERDNPNPYISNRQTVYNNKPNFVKVEFPNKGLLSETGSIIMVTIKGKTENG